MNKKAFTLIEIIIATSILTIAFLWVYKLIWENTKIINYSNDNIIANSLFSPLKECLNNIWFDNFKNDPSLFYDFNFWASPNLDNCLTWTTNKVILNNIEYKLSWNITSSWADFIDWKLNINSDLNEVETTFKQKK
jgi:prepilin-type N-terminal cleavage/methylation domain-containing protein